MLHDFYYFTVLSKKSLDVLNIFLHIGVFHMLKHGILRGKGTCKDKKKSSLNCASLIRVHPFQKFCATRGGNVV